MKIKIKRSPRKNKKYMVSLPEGEVHFGHPDYRIKPGTDDGDNYCSRSYGITGKNGKPTRDDPYSANFWSRLMWGCGNGKKSSKQKALKVGDSVSIKKSLL